MTAPTTGQTLDVTIDKLVFGGYGLARHDGLVLFVPFGAPGDHLRVEITQVEKKHVRARIVEILAPSPHRRQPRCRHFGDCGGCQFQHVDYREQLRAKSEFVREALIRTGGFDWPEPVVVQAGDEWGYRSRTQLKVYATSKRRADGSIGRVSGRAAVLPETDLAVGAPRLGFHRAFTHDIVDIAECPVLAPALEQGLQQVRAAIAPLTRDQMPYQIDGACGTDGATFAPDIPGLRKDLVEHRVGGFRYLIEPESFFQGNRHLVDRLVQGAIGDERGELAYDLYAGVGLFTLPLSRRFTRVVAVEDERRAATLGRVNVKNNGCDNVSYLRSTTEQFLAGNQPRPDLVLMDPPRLGAKPAIPLLLRMAPRRLVYVSCDPNTLARDLRQLCDGGYEVEQVEAYDMFPQTFHVESIARLRHQSPA
ncbi:MAG: class I SAM-dependent RNA methyltransferase [Planctomycetes bacterium]|nr:class I SAM-dependent RNA methyltransferase [Planctomycetota bacterium]